MCKPGPQLSKNTVVRSDFSLGNFWALEEEEEEQ